MLKRTCEVLTSNLDRVYTKIFLSRVAMVGWSIWKARNEFIFQNSPIVTKLIAVKDGTSLGGNTSC